MYYNELNFFSCRLNHFQIVWTNQSRFNRSTQGFKSMSLSMIFLLAPLMNIKFMLFILVRLTTWLILRSLILYFVSFNSFMWLHVLKLIVLHLINTGILRDKTMDDYFMQIFNYDEQNYPFCYWWKSLDTAAILCSNSLALNL